MKEIKKGSVLVIFGQNLPRKSKKWWQQFEKVIGPEILEEKIRNRGVDFIAIESLTSPGSIQEAHRLVSELPHLTQADGRRISKLVNWQGYELWWMHFDDLMYQFCLPYTQYRTLLLYLKDFNKIYLYQVIYSSLFQYFLNAHNRPYVIFGKFRLRNLLPLPFGVFVQLVLSLGFLLWLKITKPRLMVWTSDKFDHPHDYDFRMKFVYEELRKRKIHFVEFIRSLESWPVVLRHAWRRKRPVVYSAAIINILHFLASHLGGNKNKELDDLSLSSAANPEEHFWFMVVTHYLHNIKGTVWSIRTMEFILRWTGVRVAYVSAGCNRTFHEVLGCKLLGIKTVGIQHAAIPKYAFIADFMPGFDGKLPLSVDGYGLWSNWWKEYYLSHSRAYRPEQLYVSGPARPLEKNTVVTQPIVLKNRPLKVLFVSEQLADPSEVMPYLLKLLEIKDFILSLKARPYRDGFEEWLKANRPEILKKVRVFRDTQQAISQSDVVVGSHSTVVLEALLQLKPLVFFWTNKWGDYFDIKSSGTKGRYFANNPEELVDYIRKSSEIPKEVLKQLQEQFFGDPHQNGGKWVVEQAMKYLNEYKKDGTR